MHCSSPTELRFIARARQHTTSGVDKCDNLVVAHVVLMLYLDRAPLKVSIFVVQKRDRRTGGRMGRRADTISDKDALLHLKVK